MKPTVKQLEQWARIRRRGRESYIWYYGVFGWGLTTGVGWAFFMALTQGWDRLPLLMILALIIFPIGGYVFGVIMWKVLEKRYQQSVHGYADKMLTSLPTVESTAESNS